MKIVLFGSSGTVGRAVADELGHRHDLIRVGRASGDVNADVTDPASVNRLLETLGKIDALVCATGKVHFGPLGGMTSELLSVGLRDKLLGQANVALAGQRFLADGGSITLSSGILSEAFIRDGSSASMVNGAIEAFVRAAAIELTRGMRINVVNASVLEEAMGAYGPYFRGFESVPAARVALAYSRSVEGAETGQIYRVR